MRFALLLAALFVAPAASAQVSAQQGQIELAGSASFTSTDGTTAFTLAPSVGYFFTDAVQFGLETVYIKIQGVDGAGSIGPFAAYHFGTRAQALRPFVQAQLGVSLESDTALSFGGAGGVKYFFLPGGALRAQGFVNTGNSITTFGALGGVSIVF